MPRFCGSCVEGVFGYNASVRADAFIAAVTHSARRGSMGCAGNVQRCDACRAFPSDLHAMQYIMSRLKIDYLPVCLICGTNTGGPMNTSDKHHPACGVCVCRTHGLTHDPTRPQQCCRMGGCEDLQCLWCARRCIAGMRDVFPTVYGSSATPELEILVFGDLFRNITRCTTLKEWDALRRAAA